MKKILFVLSAAALLSACGETAIDSREASKVIVPTSTDAVYETVKAGSKVTWTGSHLLGVDPHTGYVNVSSGKVSTTDGTITAAKFVIDMNGITDTDIEKEEKRKGLEGHLKNQDFFNVEKHPTSHFELTEIKGAEGDFNSEVTGNLTILDSARSITFPANVNVTNEAVQIKSAEFGIDRTQWGINFSSEGMAGVVKEKAIANTIKLTIEATVEK